MNLKQIGGLGVSESMEEASEARKQPKRRQQKKRKKKQRTKTDLPIEIVREILDRLPLKSVARFKCVSKRWRSLGKDIARQRFHDEWRRVMPRVFESGGGMDDLSGGWAEGPDEGRRAGGGGLGDGLEEVRSGLDFLDGIDRYLPERGDVYHVFRVSLGDWARSARHLLATARARF